MGNSMISPSRASQSLRFFSWEIGKLIRNNKQFCTNAGILVWWKGKSNLLCVCVMMFFWKCFASERDAGSPTWSGSDDAFIGLSREIYEKHPLFDILFMYIRGINMQYLNNYEKGLRWERRCQPYSTNPMLKIFRLRSINEDIPPYPQFFLTNTKALWSPKKNLEFLEWQIFSKAKIFVFDLIMCNVLV